MIFTSHTLVSYAHEQKAQWACIMHWWALPIGVATVANKKALFVRLVDRIPWFDAHWSQFFAEFDWFVVLTSRLDTYISANDNNDDTTDCFTPCCACVHGIITCILAIRIIRESMIWLFRFFVTERLAWLPVLLLKVNLTLLDTYTMVTPQSHVLSRSNL